MPRKTKIHYAGGPDPKIGAHVQSACGALATLWTLDAPLTRDVQSVTCGACQRSHLWRFVAARTRLRMAAERNASERST